MNIYKAGNMRVFKYRYYAMDQASNMAVIDGKFRGVVCLANWLTMVEF